MPKFLKLKLNNCKEADVCWKLVISNIDEFTSWCEYDAHANMNAFISLIDKCNEELKFRNLSAAIAHAGGLSSRESGLGSIISMATYKNKDEKIYPILEVAKITDLKHQGILKAILRGNDIAIASNGSWTTLDSFMSTWKCEILSEIEKDDFGFPLDYELNADTIVLENAPNTFHKYISERVQEIIKDAGNVGFIYNLKEIDSKFVFKAIYNAKNIYIESQFEDEKQISSMAKLFLSVERKNVYIKCSKNAANLLKSHPAYDSLFNHHNIYFSSFQI